ncbi:mitofusin-1 [Engraulis encrasicolus]|uniref:mitofusin-1 n=1 Tax=Engraulis encrasicolus TaxID=184585 RepID=UPI002FD2E91C
MDLEEISPLKHFVVAKRTISAIFDLLQDFAKDASGFVEETLHSEDLEQVASEEQCEQMQACMKKLATIREVLARRHMKVAFFGRTSNGKSTVINAMLRERVLPSGIGHTTNCFLSVEGTDGKTAHLTPEGSDEKQNIETVNHLAHALHMDRSRDSGCLVRMFWPKTKCALLRDDLVLMDSPGIDVTSELDSWIDKFCLDADVFVLVANAESTLMNTEKHFFHRVSERISKPNIFILNNRWDVSASEPEYLEDVRRQHMERCVSFLMDELRVVDAQQAPNRIFFVSAKEVLNSRMHRAQGMPETGGALAEGFQERLKEFQSFERTFEEFISQSAVKTKFEQHTIRGWQITESVKAIMDAINITSAEQKVLSLEERESLMDRLEFVRDQLNVLTEDVKEKIKATTDEVAAKVTAAMLEEIKGLSTLVNEFCSDFSPNPNALALYKTKLQIYVEERMGRNLAYRCASSIHGHMQSSQRNIMDSIRPLLLPSARSNLHLHLPSHKFDISFDLNLATLCEDFRGNIEFQFSLGWTALVHRFLGPANAKHALVLLDKNMQAAGFATTPMDPQTQEDLAISMATKLASYTSRATMGLVVICGVVWRCLGWRLIVFSSGLYGMLYLYERLNWTNGAREKALKQQFVDFTTPRLLTLTPITSAHCSQQVQQEMVSTFSRLSQQVDKSEGELETDIWRLNSRIQRLERVQRQSKTLRHRATDLERQLEIFTSQYLHATP